MEEDEPRFKRVKDFGNSRHVILPKGKYLPGQMVAIVSVDTDRCPYCGSRRIEPSGRVLHMTCMDCEKVFKLWNTNDK